MSRTRPASGRSRARSRLQRAGLALATFTATAAALVPAHAVAADPPVTLQSVFVSPVSSTEYRCSPETATAATILANAAANADTTQAGASHDLCLGFTLPSGVAADGDDMKKLAVTLPAGLAGEVGAIPTCSDDEFALGTYSTSTCPDASMVGTTFVRLTPKVPFPEAPGPGDPPGPRPISGYFETAVGLGGTAAPVWDDTNERWDGVAAGGFLYNLVPGPNELARIGASIRPSNSLSPAKFVISLRLASDGSGRIQTVVDNAPKTVYWNGEDDGYLNPDGTLTSDAVAGDIYVRTIGIRVWGAPADRTLEPHTTGGVDYPEQPIMGGHTFLQFGTNCVDDVTASIEMTTYGGVQSSMSSNAIKPTGCDQLPFAPSVSFATTATSPATPTGLDVSVGVDQALSANGDRAALLRDASVTMPAGLEIGAQVASGPNGLPLCSEAQFGKNTTADNTCPAGSNVGAVTIETPLINKPFRGNVYLGQQSAVGELPPLYLQATLQGSSGDDAPRIKLVGSVKVDENGRMTTTFKDAPQLRFSSLKISFPAGDNALFITPRSCDTATGSSSFTSWAGQTATVEASIKMTTDCELPAFNPAIAMVPSNNTVAAKAPTKVIIARGDREPWMKDVTVALPTGFLSDLTVVEECSKAAAAAANCPESSRIGSVTSEAGAGAKPLSLAGSMYLVERDEGSVAGAVIVVRAKIGELDLGNVVVPSKINLSPTDAVLSLTTSAPLRFKGLALNLRSIVVDLNRENFPLNPTSCGPLTAYATITADTGATATPNSGPIPFSGCAALPFQPAFDAKLSGDTKAGGHPQVDVTMIPRAGDSNLKSAKVVLPAGVSTDPKNLQNICPQADFLAGTCAEATRVGTVTASVAITNEAITGGVYLVKRQGFVLPGLGMAFTGRYAQRLLSTVAIDRATARVITEFSAIPDLPLRRLQMTIAGGAKGPIQLSPDACTADTAWDATFGGQGGQTNKVSVPIPCPITKTTQSWSRKTGLKLTLAAPTGKTFKSTKLTLPSGFKLKSGKTRTKYAKIKLAGGKGKTKLTSTSLAVTARGAGPSKVTYTISAKGYTLPKSYKGKLKKGKTIKLKFRSVTSDGTVSSKTLRVKVK